VLRRVEYQDNLTRTLCAPGRDPAPTPALNVKLPEAEGCLWHYGVVSPGVRQAYIPSIGPLLEADARGSFRVVGRPLTFNMSSMRQLGNILAAVFPAKDTAFATADEWYIQLTTAHLAPAQFVLDPPWWLLFETPEMWKSGGVEEWSKAYEPQLQILLRTLEDQGDGAAFLDGY
jgi:hypothetical protein